MTRATEQEMQRPARILQLPGVHARTGLSRSTICLRVTEGSFPKLVRAVGWIEVEVDTWIRQQIAASQGDAQ